MSWDGYLVLGLIALVLAYIVWTALASKSMAGRSVEVLDPALPEFSAHRAKAVVYCYSHHCPPCREMAPDIARLREQHPNVFKLDISQHAKEALAIGIRATPTTLLVEDGKVVKVLLGARAVPAIEVFLEAS